MFCGSFKIFLFVKRCIPIAIYALQWIHIHIKHKLTVTIHCHCLEKSSLDILPNTSFWPQQMKRKPWGFVKTGGWVFLGEFSFLKQYKLDCLIYSHDLWSLLLYQATVQLNVYCMLLWWLLYIQYFHVFYVSLCLYWRWLIGITNTCYCISEQVNTWMKWQSTVLFTRTIFCSF